MEKRKILLIGLGSIGQRHVKYLKEKYPDVEISVLRRPQSKDVDPGIRVFISKVFKDVSEALSWQPDIVFVTNPAISHIDSAKPFIEQGSAIFFEKPLDVDSEKAINLVENSNNKMMVGYVLRYKESYPELKEILKSDLVGNVQYIRAEVGSDLRLWRKKTYENSVSTKKSLGGGIINELSHEIDYVVDLFGIPESVIAVKAKVSNLNFEQGTEDLAEIIFKFKSKYIASIHLDMIDKSVHRSCCIVGEKGTVLWDVLKGTIVFEDSEKREVLYEEKTLDKKDMFFNMYTHFFSYIDGKQANIVSLKEGLNIIEIIEKIKLSADQKKEILI